MDYIANQRIRKGGKMYLPGDRVPLDADDLQHLPDGAVSEPPEDTDAPIADLDEALKRAVAALPDEAFKKDGGIRTDALRDLSEQIGRDVTAQDVKGIQNTPGV